MARFLRHVASARRRKETFNKRNLLSLAYRDPTPWIEGTIPEKIIINRLLIMQIPFESQGYININIPEIDLNKDYRPDIFIPDLKLIIQIQGAYFHSKPAQVEADAYTNALYEAVGYRVIDWWDYDILTNVDALFASEPQLNNYTGRRGGRETTLRQSNIDDTKGIRTLNQKRARGATAARVSTRKLRKPTFKTTANKAKGSRVK